MTKYSPLFIAASALLFAACTTDTTGLSESLTLEAHPDTNANAAVTITEFADLQCPACKAAKDVVLDDLIAERGDDFRLEFRHFPLSAIHRYAMEAAEATECAGDQGKFWDMVDVIYDNQSQLSSETLDTWGEELGLDMDLYGRCRDSHVKRDAILDQYAEGQSAGVRGTPTFFVNGQQVPSTKEALTNAIDSTMNEQAELL